VRKSACKIHGITISCLICFWTTTTTTTRQKQQSAEICGKTTLTHANYRCSLSLYIPRFRLSTFLLFPLGFDSLLKGQIATRWPWKWDFPKKKIVDKILWSLEQTIKIWKLISQMRNNKKLNSPNLFISTNNSSKSRLWGTVGVFHRRKRKHWNNDVNQFLLLSPPCAWQWTSLGFNRSALLSARGQKEGKLSTSPDSDWLAGLLTEILTMWTF
jgi:hypothetical protein